jgi:hypothetical protein
MRLHSTFIAIGALLVAACSEPTAPPTSTALTKTPLAAITSKRDGKAQESNTSCTFSRGTTTCVTTTQHEETTTHQVFGSCVAGPSGQPGRRITTFEDRYLVTETTTTSSHGRSGHVYSSNTETTRVLVSSREISRVCEAL